ncbi:MAG TPA: DUF502 domain-containing protein [Gemmatimonadaceae bacterium]|nr:DUF502 domain-containing protein [Gemmatimonadaceae bacterium]
MMRSLLKHFLRGLLVTGPVALTLFIVWTVFRTIDGWLKLPIPGAGFVITIVGITLVGFVASNLVARQVLGTFEDLLKRLPFVRLLYSSSKDLLGAFVGEQRRFDRPVIVTLYGDGGPKAIGFQTKDSLAEFGLPDHVAVYLPESYNFAGNLFVVPRSRVTPIDGESAQVMAFVVSGGVAKSDALPPG